MLPAPVQQFIDAEIAANRTDFTDLRAVIVNGTLKRSPEPTHTDGLIAVAAHVLNGAGARVDAFRTVDTIPPGVYPDMREHGWETDDFPDPYRTLIEPADIVVLATPIWLGDQSSTTTVARRATGPPATPSSPRGTCCTPRAGSRTTAASRPTAT